MRTCLRVAVAVGGLLLASGCRPDVKQLRTMQDRPIAAEDAAVKLADLATHFVKPERPAWRAEAMTTMVRLDAAQPADARDAELHARLVALLKAEYLQPQLKLASKATPETTAQELHVLRAWAVHSLGAMGDPGLNAYMVEAIRSHDAATDGNWLVRRAAMDALAPLADALAADAPLRNALLAHLPLMQSELDRSAGGPSHRAARQACEFFEHKLKSYPALVELLREAADGRLPDASTLQLLEWNYQRLRLGDHQAAAGSVCLDDNLRSLLTLAWHPTASVRTRARVILTEQFPVPLLAACGEALRQGRLPDEDAVLLAGVLPGADRAAGHTPSAAAEAVPAPSGGYADTRGRAIDALFARMAQVPTDRRDIVYTRLLAHDPQRLRVELCRLSPRVLGEADAQASQHVRYLNHLRTGAGLPLTDAQRQELATLMAAFVEKPSAAVRRELTTYLVGDEPLLLAVAAARRMEHVADEPPEPASALVASYVACLEAFEGGRGAAAYDARTQALFPSHPWDVLGRAMGRNETPVTAAAATFLRERSPERLLRLLAQQVAARQASGATVPYAEYVILGDTVAAAAPMPFAERRAAGLVAARQAAVDALRAGSASPVEETALLCARYLLELGETVPEAARGSPAVRALVETAVARPTAANTNPDSHREATR
ncbi:MAG TPA: hypothetical protein PLP01_06330 [Phycisphaerae bacterium]|nr:hypothetical protein [Phycisphaerae bacterium]